MKCIVIVLLIHTLLVQGQNTTENMALKDFVEKTLGLYEFNKNLAQMGSFILAQTACNGCAIGVGLFQHFVKMGKQENDVANFISFFCKTFNIQSADKCDGIGRNFAPDVTHIIKVSHVQGDEFCSAVLGDWCHDAFSERNDWNVTVNQKPQMLESKTSENAPTLKMLHIADTHIDELYAEGSNAACRDALCCRMVPGEKPPESNSSKAGKWGDYRKCDTPIVLMDNMLDHIKQQHGDIDFVIWTGDLPPHDLWNLTKESNLRIIKDGIAQMHKAFPNITVYPAIGNHETVPINNFPTEGAEGVGPDGFNMTWLYKELDIEWGRWLPPSTSETIRRGAYYSVLAGDKLRIISINSNFCYNLNWWLMVDAVDPADQLLWLIDELQSAEDKGEKVHLIGHVPPGSSDCVKVWSRNFNKIIERYEATVMGQYYGHTHFDEFAVQYDMDTSTRPINVQYIGPSVTPYEDLNPAYRIFHIDGDHPNTTRAIIDHETWTMNLTHANLHNGPLWYKLYSARDAYNLTSLAPSQWSDFITAMTEDESSFDLYYKHYYRDSDVMPKCDHKCRKSIMCDSRSGRSHDRKKLCSCIDYMVDEEEKMQHKKNLYTDLALRFANPLAWFRPSQEQGNISY